MTDYIEMLLNRFIVEKDQKNYRVEATDPYAQARIYQAEKLTDTQRSVKRLEYMLENEKPVVYKDEKIALIRTLRTIPEIFTEEEWTEIKKDHYIHEQGKLCNINPDYMLLLKSGFAGKRAEINAQLAEECSEEKKATLESMLSVMDLISKFAARYREEALKVGNTVVADTFSRIPEEAPKTLLEALQFLRLVHYCLWCSFNYHNTLGRFDQYMYPFYKNDIDAGLINKDEALELVEEFFISCNKDSDMYMGMQQGDNGQSLVLGGINVDGTESYNDFSDICLQASLEVKLIDPKINLRVNKNTPLELYEKGSHLTQQGLGFPQYANDDIVIPALKKWGYSDEDAHNYVVAACWEFIIPGRGTDIPNLNTMSYVKSITTTLDQLTDCESFDDYLELVHKSIDDQAEKLMQQVTNIYMEPAPLMSLIMENCVESGKDVSKGSHYNNYGFHGAGLSTAVDSLAAIRKYVYEDKMITPEKMIEMCKSDFKGHEEIQNMLRFEAPKMGYNDETVDEIASKLLGWFADALEGRHNDQGGIFRAGTGSAMYYIWDATETMATPDGRKEGEELACNYSPSLFSKCPGPISIIKSFASPDLTRVCNGGPLTIELTDTLFRNDESIRKVAMFVKSFIDMGGHQMQINAVNRDKMLDAKKHPEKYRNLIVRVWGWSGYFVELDECYQDHIIKRMELAV